MTTLALAVSAASFADTPMADYGYNNTPTEFTFTGGVGGGIVTSPVQAYSMAPNLPLDLNTVLSINGVTETAPTVTNGNVVSAAFSGGSFSLVDGPTTLLSGTFTGSSLDYDIVSGSGAGSGANSPLYSMEGITYTGGTYLTDWETVNGEGPPVTGTGNLSLSAATPPASTGAGGYFAAFTSDDVTGTWDAAGTPLNTSVPEPSAMAAMAIGGIGLLGMMVVARRRTGLQF